MLDLAGRLEGIARHVSVHAAAVVISDRDLTDYVPSAATRTAACTQYAMNPVVDVGLVKMDFLGLKTLTVISPARGRIIKRNHGVAIDVLQQLPLDDPPTYELPGRGDTVAVFQLESDGMRKLLRQLRPNRFEHIIAVNAFYRPGPMHFAPAFLRGRHGARGSTSHPACSPSWRRPTASSSTRSRSAVATDLAGFSHAAAEIIMRAMAKKQAAKMEQMKPLFFEGLRGQRAFPQLTVRAVSSAWYFSNYGFDRSTSAGLRPGGVLDSLSEGQLSGGVPGRATHQHHGSHR